MRKVFAGLLVVCLLIGSVGALVAPAAAQDSTETESGLMFDERLDVDNDTQSLWVDVEDTNGTDILVTFYGVDSDGNETEVSNSTLNAAENETVTAEFLDVDPANYTEYRVTVDGDGDDPAMIDAGVIQRSSGGVAPAGFDFGGVLAFLYSEPAFGVPIFAVLLGLAAVIAVATYEDYI